MNTAPVAVISRIIPLGGRRDAHAPPLLTHAANASPFGCGKERRAALRPVLPDRDELLLLVDRDLPAGLEFAARGPCPL